MHSESIAGLDYGSNSLRLLIATADESGTSQQICRDRIELRLASDAFNSGMFSPATIEKLVEASNSFAARMNECSVTRYRAVGTEAFRRTTNSFETIEKVFEQTDIKIEVIDYREEATLIAEAVNQKDRDVRRADLIVDLGGGSLELISPSTDRGGEPVGLESHPLGLSVQLESMLEKQTDGIEIRREMSTVADLVGRELRSELLDGNIPVDVIALTGGQAEMINHLALRWGFWEEQHSRIDGVNPEQLDNLCVRIISESTENLVGLGVNEQRALLLPGAAALYLSICERSGAHAILLPCVGLIDGLLLNMKEKGRNWSNHSQTRH